MKERVFLDATKKLDSKQVAKKKIQKTNNNQILIHIKTNHRLKQKDTNNHPRPY